VLPLETVLEAVLHLDRLKQGELSRGEVLQMNLVSDPEAGDSLEVLVRAADESMEWHPVDLPTVTAAIISYCRAKRIPLPYSGVKSLALTGEGVAFRIENTVQLAAHNAAPADIAGRPLRYAKGYEPHAILPCTRNVAQV
jgi:hypothetical protein